jgi:hypothetical protein
MTIGELWAEYLEQVVPRRAGEEQREETKRAFYAGANGMFGAMLTATEPEDEDVCEQRLAALRSELDDFLHNFKRRHRL